jgi:hypothetical protein
MSDDLVIRLIDAIHTEKPSKKVADLLREAASDIQDMRLFMAFPPMDVEDTDVPFPDVKGNG